MLSAMLADVTARPFLGSGPFLSGFPPGIVLHHPQNYLLVALLAVLATLIGIGFKNVLYTVEDLCDRAWRGRPEWARPAVGGIVLGLLLLAIPQLYGVGYPVMYQAVGGRYALWFLIVLAAGKMIATSLTIGIGGSGGVFAPSLFVGATSGMAFGEIARHLLGPGAGQPALYAVVAMGAVFTAAARAPLTSLASVVEMTGDFALTLPVMLAVAIATAVSRALSYGTIYTTKLLRRGIDIDRTTPWRALQDLKVADAMRALPQAMTPPATALVIAMAPMASRLPPPPVCPDRSSAGVTHRHCSLASHLARRSASWSSTAATGCRCSPTTTSACKAGSPTTGSSRQSPKRSTPPSPKSPRASSPPNGRCPTPRRPCASRPPRCADTRSWKSPSQTAPQPSAKRCARSPGRPAVSLSPCYTIAGSATPTPTSRSSQATESSCSPASRPQRHPARRSPDAPQQAKADQRPNGGASRGTRHSRMPGGERLLPAEREQVPFHLVRGDLAAGCGERAKRPD